MARKTLSDRLNALHSERLAAVDVFTKSAAILDETADAYQELADTAYEEAQERTDMGGDATRAEHIAREQARKIRELVVG
jgi:hypothetical protein